MSPVYYNDPARWYADENQRRDEQMRGLLNMVMAAKKFKYDQGQDEWSRDLQERQLGEQTRRNDVYEANQSERVQYPPEYIMKIQHPELFPEKAEKNDMGDVPAEIGVKVRSILGIPETAWGQMTPKARWDAYQEFQIRTRPTTAQKTPASIVQYKRDAANVAGLFTRYDKDVAKLEARMRPLRAKIDKDEYGIDPDAAAAKEELLALENEKETMDAWKGSLDRYRSELWGGDPLSDASRAEIEAMLNPPKPTETKVVGGVTYEKKSDGLWYKK